MRVRRQECRPGEDLDLQLPIRCRLDLFRPIEITVFRQGVGVGKPDAPDELGLRLSGAKPRPKAHQKRCASDANHASPPWCSTPRGRVYVPLEVGASRAVKTKTINFTARAAKRAAKRQCRSRSGKRVAWKRQRATTAGRRAR